MDKQNFDLQIEQARANEAARLKTAMEHLLALKEGISDGKARGQYMAEINLQKLWLVGVKAGKNFVSPSEKSALYEGTKKCFKGKNTHHAVDHLDVLFKLPALAQSSGGGDAVKAQAVTQAVAKADVIDAKVAAPLVARPAAAVTVGNVSSVALKN